MWNQRYSEAGYAYGTQPNDFLVAMQDKLPQGRLLCLAEGEGRNAVFLAEQGYQVVAVDSSEVGLSKAQALAEQRGVRIEIQLADLETFEIGEACWDGIVSIFCHLPALMRSRLHRCVVDGLSHGGVFVLEAYRPEQLQFKTGGPPCVEMMMTLNGLKQELDGLVFHHGLETEREIHEGDYHNGMGAVVQVLASK